MRWPRKLPLRFRSLFHKREVDRELDDELRFHLDCQIAANMASGMSRDEARNAALRTFGGVEQSKEACRDTHRANWFHDVLQDARYGTRVLRKSPSFAAIAILTLALGIAANTAIFSILESQLWRPLPFPDSERLMEPHLVLRQNPRQWDVLSIRGFQAWREQSRSFTSLAGFLYPESHNFRSGGTADRVTVMTVTSNYFDTVRLPIARGRPFLPAEESPGLDRVAIISNSLWRDRFASDAAVLGKSITLDGEAYTIVGIAPREFHFPFADDPAIFVPLAMDISKPVLRDLEVIARLAPGATKEQAAGELTSILEHEQKGRGIQPEDRVVVQSFREVWTQDTARPLLFFAGAVALVLLIACVNTAGLLFARGLTRQREFAVRAALGAPRGRIVRQLLVESVILAMAGGVLGALAGYWFAGLLTVFVPPDMLPRHAPASLDWRVLLFTLGISILSAMVAGVAPAMFASRTNLNDTMRRGAPGRSEGRSQRRTRSSLLAIEVALGLVLLFGAGLFLSSFVRLEQVPRGFDAPGALTFRVTLRGNSYTRQDQVLRYFTTLAEQLRAMPGVRSVTLASSLPLTGAERLFANVNVAGQPPIQPDGVSTIEHAIAANYPEALRIPLLAGRTFNARDTEDSPRVAIINRNAVRKLFGAASPLGKVLDFVTDQPRGVPAEPPVQIVGVMENAQEFGANEVAFDDLFVPFSQHPVNSAFVLVDSNIPRGVLAGGVREAAFALDKDQPVFDMKTMDDYVAESLDGDRFNLFMAAALAAAAIILVSIGIFGTAAYFVAQRTQEFGIRLALGASPARVLRHAIAQSLRIGITGLAVGVLASLALGGFLQHVLYLVPGERAGMLYGVKVYDPLAMLAASAILTAVLVLASYIPARRAAKLDATIALRHE